MHLIFHNTFSGRAEFEMSEGSRPWDILLLTAEGSFSVTFPRLNQTYVIEADQIAYFPANEEFHREVLSPIRFHQFAFLPEADHPFYPALTAGKLTIPEEQVATMTRNLDRIAVMPNNRELILHSIEHILAEQFLFGKGEPSHPQGVDEDVLSVLRYMNEHLHQKISIPYLADLVHLSHTGLLWKFHRQLGTTPSQCLTMLRLRYAKQLLLDGQLRINEIATRCGYTNAYYFTNAFRAECGVSPTEFRKQYLNQ